MIPFDLAAKVVGSVAILSSALLWARSQKNKDTERLARLEGQIAFVRFVRDRIDRYLSPISEIMRDCDEGMFCAVCLGCDSRECVDINALRSLLRSGDYYSDGGEIMDSFLASLGSSYRENEIAGCDLCLKELTALYEKLARELPRERKGRCVLAVCLAAGIVIIFI